MAFFYRYSWMLPGSHRHTSSFILIVSLVSPQLLILRLWNQLCVELLFSTVFLFSNSVIYALIVNFFFVFP